MPAQALTRATRSSRGTPTPRWRTDSTRALMSYDETEGLLSAVGIVAALALSFVIGLQSSLSADSVANYMCANLASSRVEDARFQHACFHDKNFCEYAVRVVEKQDGYNASVLIDYRDGQEHYFNVSQNLCASFVSDENGGFEREGSQPNPTDSYWGIKSRNDANFSTAIPFVAATFPMEYMAGNLVYHDKALLEDGIAAKATTFYRACAKATGTLTYALLISVILYVSLSFGEARERIEAGDDGVLRKFHFWFQPTIMTCYIAVMCGCTHFFFAFDSHVRIATPLFGKGALARQQTYVVIIGGAITAPTILYLAYGMWKISVYSNGAIHPIDIQKPAGDEVHSGDGDDACGTSDSPSDSTGQDEAIEEIKVDAAPQDNAPLDTDEIQRMEANVNKSTIVTVFIAVLVSWPW